MKNWLISVKRHYQFPQDGKLSTDLYTAVYTSNTVVVPFEKLGTWNLCTLCTALITSINELNKKETTTPHISMTAWQ